MSNSSGLRNARRSLGLSISALAGLADVSDSTIQACEKGHFPNGKSPSASMYAAYHRGLMRAERWERTHGSPTRADERDSPLSDITSAGTCFPHDRDSAESLLVAFGRSLPDNLYFRDWHAFRDSLPLADFSYRIAADWKPCSRGAARVLYFAGRLAVELDNVETAERCLRELIAIAKRSNEGCADLKGSALNDLASIESSRGQYHRACDFFLEAARAHGFDCGVCSEPIAGCLANLASVLTKIGENVVAASFAEQAISMLQQLHGDDVSNQEQFAWALHTKAKVERSRGNSSLALALIDDSIKAMLGPNEWDKDHQLLGFHYLERARDLDGLGSLEDAIRYSEKALNVRANMLCEDHIAVNITKAHLAQLLYRARRKRATRKRLISESYEVLRTRLPDDDVDLMAIKKRLGLT